MEKNLTDVKDEMKTEKNYYTKHFYASPPYPLPASDYTKSLISWDVSFDLNESIKGVFDMYGAFFEGKENITVVNTIGKAQAELTWNCTHAPSGIYFILVRHNGTTDCIPVLVAK
jgi:hypothetical protein